MSLPMLRAGDVGDAVSRWQLFLRGQGHEVQDTGTFDGATLAATKAWQTVCGLKPDGVVGNATYAMAGTRGFRIADESAAPIDDRHSPAWPPKPPGIRQMDTAARNAEFGHFEFIAAPMPSNPEAIRITDRWAERNLAMVDTPMLSGLHISRVRIHAKIAKQFTGLLSAWGQAGLLGRITSWDGAYAPRFVRGCAARGLLSPHAWGSAFDINAGANQMHTRPALVGERGCVRELAAIAPDFGFYWGGWFNDGMHFEAFRVLP